MTRKTKIIALTAAALALGAGIAGVARAQSSNASVVAAAVNAGTIGEQADGYLGVRGTVSPAVKSAMEAINIGRRSAYTELATKRGVTVQDVAASVGCQTLANRVAPGQAYLLRDGIWRVRKDATPIALPDYCAS